VDEVLIKSGVKTSDVMRCHGLRKFFLTQCESSPMKSIKVKMLMGHDIGVTGHYYRPKESELLEDYMKAVDALTKRRDYRSRYSSNKTSIQQNG
jgi:integrase